MSMLRTLPDDMDNIAELIESSGESENKLNEVLGQVKMATDNEGSSSYLSFTAKIMGTVIATFLLTREVNMPYYLSHFHLQD
jgi:hypothetical protein